MQSPSTPVTPPGRNPGVLPGGVMGSHTTSPDTSESGAVPTRLELHRQIKQQGKLQQQIKSRLVRATLNIQGSLEAAQAKLDSNAAELWEAIEDEVQERKQEVPSLQGALDDKVEMITQMMQTLRIGVEESLQALGGMVHDQFATLEERIMKMEEQLVSVADRAQRGIDAAVKETMEQLAASQNREPSDWSDWSLLDSEDFQELARRVEALESDWAWIPGEPGQYRLEGLQELYKNLEERVADMEIGGPTNASVEVWGSGLAIPCAR